MHSGYSSPSFRLSRQAALPRLPKAPTQISYTSLDPVCLGSWRLRVTLLHTTPNPGDPFMTATTPATTPATASATTPATQPLRTLGSAPCSAGVDRLRGTIAEKRQAANLLREQNLASWIQLASVNDFIPTLQAACNRVFESFEILHGRKKAYPLPAQWKSGELIKWHLVQQNAQAFIEIEASFEVWFDSNMFKRTFVTLDPDEIVGSYNCYRHDSRYGRWHISYISSSVNRFGSVHSVADPLRGASADRRSYTYHLYAKLPLQAFPNLLQSFAADIHLAHLEIQRRQKVTLQRENLKASDPSLQALKSQLQAALETARLAAEAVSQRSMELEKIHSQNPENLADYQDWLQKTQQSTLGGDTLQHMAATDSPLYKALSDALNKLPSNLNTKES